MTVFISKAESELEEIPRYLNSQNIKGVFESLIRFEPLSFQINSPFEVIFFQVFVRQSLYWIQVRLIYQHTYWRVMVHKLKNGFLIWGTPVIMLLKMLVTRIG